MLIRKAKKEDIDKIVSLHLSAFEGYFLSLLGERFLKHLYLSFLDSNSGTLIVSEQKGMLLGFVAVAYDPELFFKSIKKKKGFKLFIATLPSFLKQPMLVIKKVIHGVFYRGGDFEKPKRAALISSIGVDPSFKGLGVGRGLLNSAESAAKLKYKSNMYLTTDKYENESVLCFYKSNGYFVTTEFKQSRERVMLVLAKELIQSEDENEC